MKKHNEGYALVLVLVVLTVLSLVAMAMTAASLKNLKNQQDSIERMEAKYAAQGEIEKVIAQLNELVKEDGSTQSVAVKSLEDLPGSTLELKTSEKSDDSENSNDLNKYLQFDQYYLLTLSVYGTVNDKKATVDCKIRITGSLATDEGEQVLLNPRWEYVSYTITEVEEVAQDET